MHLSRQRKVGRNRKRFTSSNISIKSESITYFNITQTYAIDILFNSSVLQLVLESEFKTNEGLIFVLIDKTLLNDDFHP